MVDFKKIFGSFKEAFIELQKNNPLLLASSTAFFTVFATSPIIILIVNFLSFYFKSERLSQQLYYKISTVFGEATASQIETFVNNFRSLGSSQWITVLGTVFLIFVSTTLFNVIKQALNRIWRVRINPKQKFRYTLKQRARAFVIILAAGLLFLVSLLFDATINFLKKYFEMLSPDFNAVVVQILSGIISLAIVSLWFGILFRYLPDVRIKKRALITGAIVTGFLFTIGKYILGIFLVNGNIGNIFDASASIVLFLLFIFYSSMIMYFGAAYTLVYAQKIGSKIRPKKYAERYTLTSVSTTEQVPLTEKSEPKGSPPA